jgi:hypothetical protein
MHLPVTRNPWSMRSAVKSQQRTPTPIPRLLLISCIVAAAACGTHGNSDLTGDWEGTVTEEDGTTIVCTTAGSVWGQRAQLEELLTLDEGRHGPPLADVRGIAAAGDRFYVLDVEEGALQVYDTTGLYLETIGRSGEGPGEFRRPVDLAVDPIRDRLYVRDAQLRRISVFRLDGSLVTTWNTPTIPGLLRPMVLTQGGELYVASNLNPTAGPAEWRQGMVSCGSEGVARDTLAPPETVCSELELTFAGTTRGAISVPVPFSPERVWALTPQRSLVSGCSDRYSITYSLPDSGLRIVERDNWDVVPVDRLEAEWHRAATTARIRLDDPGWTWSGPAIPGSKPAYNALYTDTGGRLWVLRPGPGRELVDGIQKPDNPLDYFRKPRWEDTHLLEAFDAEGRFLGQLTLPPGMRVRPFPWIEGARLLALVEAEDGEVTVRAFRMQTPGEHP